MSLDQDPCHNKLLAALPEEERARVFPDLELVEMPLGDVLYSPDKQIKHVYFPTTAIVSLLHVMESGASAEIAVVGKEGIVGISLFMGGETTSSWATIENRVFPSRNITTLVATLYPGVNDPDGTNGRL